MSDFSRMAAELGRRGGKVSKRPPGALKRILLEICEELDAWDNRSVLDYWQRYSTSVDADTLAPEDSCWFRHSIRAYPIKSNDPGAYYAPFKRMRSGGWYYTAKPEPWDDLADGDYSYRYFDGEQGQETSARRIRETMARIRKARVTDRAKRLAKPQ